MKKLTKGFSDFKEAEGKQYLGLDPDVTIAEVPEEFRPSAVAGDTAVPGAHGRSVSDIINHAVDDILLRSRVYSSFPQGTEYTRRELISPILVAAALIALDVGLCAELGLSGRLGSGPVDYVFVYRFFFVLLTEAKVESKFTGAIIGQARDLCKCPERTSPPTCLLASLATPHPHYASPSVRRR